MAADVRSIDALRDWHAALTGYGEMLAESLAGVEMELRRAREWLEEQRQLWKQAVRDCEEEVTRAKAELSQRKLPRWDGRDPDCTVQEKNLRRAKARLEHAEEQVEKCRHWIAKMPQVVDEVYNGKARRLTNFLEEDLQKGLAALTRRLAALEAYAGLRPDYAPGPAASSVAPAPPDRPPPADKPAGA
ncbi:MAG TPA: hypothetical protein VM529_21480 [Gemmata sp.]|nr:hypothetical protein [Gemmata sp.]